ncbi:MAG: YARHG domain-containing protein, partial [Clostridiales bacterium]|nr:YARHG domain-containing protein [Clostridiales bacterium]
SAAAGQTAQTTTAPAATTTAAPVAPISGEWSDKDFILPYSNTRALTETDLSALTKEELRIARNEIYARYGRQFNDRTLQAHFDTKAWYAELPKLPTGTEPALSRLELSNIEIIRAYEAR